MKILAPLVCEETLYLFNLSTEFKDLFWLERKVAHKICLIGESVKGEIIQRLSDHSMICVALSELVAVFWIKQST